MHICAHTKNVHIIYTNCLRFLRFVHVCSALLHLELFAIPKVEELAGQPMFVNWAFSCLSANGKGAAALGRDGGFFVRNFRESKAILLAFC